MCAGVSAIPVNLQAVADSTQGKLTISAGMSTGGVNIVLAGGVVSGDTVSWSGARRQYIPPAAVQALRYQLEDGLPMTLEVAR